MLRTVVILGIISTGLTASATWAYPSRIQVMNFINPSYDLIADEVWSGGTRYKTSPSTRNYSGSFGYDYHTWGVGFYHHIYNYSRGQYQGYMLIQRPN